jgi:4-amino-4-deoxychorismate lyase
MFSFLETICILDGKAQHLDFHQMRVNETFDQFFPEWEPFDVAELVSSQTLPADGTHRLRITYQEDPEKIEILPYTKKEIKRFALVDTGEIDYGFKWAERGFFQTFLEAHPEADEVIFVKVFKRRNLVYARRSIALGNDQGEIDYRGRNRRN